MYAMGQKGRLLLEKAVLNDIDIENSDTSASSYHNIDHVTKTL